METYNEESCIATGCIISNSKYYSIPKDPESREQWLTLLGRTDLISNPNECYIVCSVHFDATVQAINCTNTDKETTKVSIKIPKACRVCLAVDRKMYHMTEYNLEKKLQFSTGISVNIEKVKFPQHICWECAAKLNAAISFRSKALLSDALMQSHLKTQVRITYQDLKIMRERNISLKSTLVVQKNVNVQNTLEIKNSKVIGGNNTIKVEENNEEEEIECPTEDFECLDEYTHVLKDPIKEENDFEIKDNSKIKNEDTFLNPTTGDGKSYVIEITVENTKNTGVTDDDVQETNRNTEFLTRNNDDDSKNHNYITIEEVVIKNKSENKKSTVKNSETKMPRIKNSVKKMSPIKNSLKKKSQIQNSLKKLSQIKNSVKNMSQTKNSEEKMTDVKKNLSDNLINEQFTVTQVTPEMMKQEIENRKNSLKYENAKFKCTECYSTFSIEECLKTHLFKHSIKSGPYVCDICKVHYKKKSDIRHHIKCHMIAFTCNTCGFTTKHRGAAKQHSQIHSELKYKCPNCPMEFETSTTYLSHLRIKHISDFVCNLCGYTFVSERGVFVHSYMKHGDIDKNIELNGPFCKECDVTFLSKEAYDRHLKLSSKHLTSESDPIRIRNKNTYKMLPEQEKFNQSPVTCQECGLKFKNYRCFTTHFGHKHRDLVQARLLTTENCICDQCGRAFASKAKLQQHSWVHTGKQHKCNQCDKSFATKHVLEIHKRTHEENYVKTYKCTVCEKEFTWLSNMKRHMFLHTGEMPFSCDVCGKKFKQIDSLQSHVKHVHQNVPWPKKKKQGKKKEMGHED